MSRPITQYKKLLNPEQVSQGINAARSNAKRLTADALILLEAERYPTAASIAALAIEEAGKVSILRMLALAQNEQEVVNTWKEYRNHRSKNSAWIIADLAAKGATHLNDLREIANVDGEHTAILDTIKQLGFYTDCYENAHWSEPSKVVDADLAKQLVWIAKILSKGDEVTPREIELWVQYLQPVWKTSEMQQGIVRWTAAMEKEGLGKYTAEKMAKFVLDPIEAVEWDNTNSSKSN